MKTYLFVLIAAFTAFSAISQPINSTDTFNLQKIIFHSSPCNGTCPSIDLAIDSNRNITLIREVYKTKSGIDKSLSGQFKGSLSAEDFISLKELLQSCKIDALTFPEIDCCDAPVITIIVYYNNKRAYLKSMLPPQTAGKLISFLTQVGTQSSLERASVVTSIEE